MKQLDDLINRITMYKLLLWGLRGLFAVSWLFSITGVLPYGAVRPLVSASILIGVCFSVNFILAKLYRVAANSESTNLTAIILFFIFQPPKSVSDGIALGLAGAIAIASKYVLTRHQRHLVNPAAFGAAIVGVAGLLHSRWWVGSDVLFIFVLAVGLLIVRKIHRFPMVLSFLATSALLAVLLSADSAQTARDVVLSFPLLFMGTIMLTEPVTTPPRRYQQILYGIIVGLLVSSGLRFSSVSMTPELSLIIGNLLVFIVATRRRQPLKFVSVSQIGLTIHEFIFKPIAPLHYLPGQYVELTLPLAQTDFRGNRRTFTIASSPTEHDVRLGIKIPQPGSAFKSALLALPRGTEVTANNLAGDFLLPENPKTKLIFIAGGIGITPFRSMLKYLTDKRQRRNITVFYAVSDPQQIVYKDILNEAKEYGVKVVYVLAPLPDQSVPASWKHEVGMITKELIIKHALDYQKSVFYISGPNVMVQANKKLLRSMGVRRRDIRTDYFSGY